MADNINECRICFQTELNDLGRLFRPCLCKGTQAYIHEECLQQWRAVAHNPTNRYQCPTCKYTYQYERIWFANLITHKIFVGICSLTIIIMAVAIVAFFIKWLAFLFIGIRLSHNFFALSGKLVWWSVLLIGAISMICFMFKEGNGPDLQISNLVTFDSYAFEIFGYGFSVIGFMVFIFSVYNNVERILDCYLRRLGDRIVEVRV